MIVVKDLSKLGRNYILTGQYTDIYFPDRGVRFIALNDRIDTINTDNDITPFISRTASGKS
jgi:DNA invertase Pin-like site-specific DNA recombinase